MRFPWKSSGLLSINFKKHRETRLMRRVRRKRSHTVWSWVEEEAGEVREHGRRCRRGKARTRGVRAQRGGGDGSIRGGRANQVKRKDGGEGGRMGGEMEEGSRDAGRQGRGESERGVRELLLNYVQALEIQLISIILKFRLKS